MAAAVHPRSPELHFDQPSSRHGTADLRELLHRVFGHSDFRPHQQPVCEAAASGRDVLLVMPTGAGKSLCYQLPALARGGTALVISPLIALMDDQAHKLAALHLRVARIHSGLPREDLREAARAYLEGRLDFLFIAPERLRVPGFPEMLARRKPALIAIDEAHCISQWGHDFRPDYRTLGQFLPALRPSPIIALTATATPTVQQDILRALALENPAVFITGFRRHNLQIEVVETSKPQRLDLMRKLLAESSARPAIIYAQSRKAAEEIAGTLGTKFSSAAYHAGLDPGTRDRVQRAFLSGKLDVVVATVAFGMGVDKADVRTVIHAALPGSVEAYYQEIGRAGRDGQPSRAILLHSFADRRTQEFLLEKNYPPVSDIERLLAAVGSHPSTLPELQEELKMERETVEQCIDKLLVQGALAAELDGTVRAIPQPNWKGNYNQQLAYRRAQIDKIVAYAEGSACRMSALVRHFGDLNDPGTPCSHCDICRPGGTAASDSHQPNSSERSEIQTLLHALQSGSRSAGKICTDLGYEDRKEFDRLAEDIAKAGLLTLTTETFRAEDGRDISYRKLALTPEGREADDNALSTVWLRSTTPGKSGRSSRNSGAPGSSRTWGRPSHNGEARARTASTHNDDPLTDEQARLEANLKKWRVETARAQGNPPFTIFHDSVLRAIAKANPSNVAQLEAIRGIGQEKSNRYGADLLALCRGEEVTPKQSSVSPSRTPNAKPHSSPSRLSAPAQQTFLTSQERNAIARPAPGGSPKTTPPRSADAPLTPAQQAVETKLRIWRTEQATASGLPTFFVLSETTLKQVASNQPQNLTDLASIPGMGPDKLQRYGPNLLDLCRT